LSKKITNSWAYKIGKSIGKSGAKKSGSWWKGILNWTKIFKGGK